MPCGYIEFSAYACMDGRYKAWKEAGLSQALDADLPVSTGAVWGLQKNTWSSQYVPSTLLCADGTLWADGWFALA